MSDEELKQLIGSNAKAVQALTNVLSQEREERNRERTQLYQALADMQRQFIDLGRRIDNNSADIRELAVENQRILRYLESLVNKPGN